jgi:hypothetical protein
MARILSQEELRRRALAVKQAGLLAKNPYPYTGSPYPGKAEITPIEEQGLLGYPVIEESFMPQSEKVIENVGFFDAGGKKEISYMHPGRNEIRIRDVAQMEGGEGEYNKALIHELRHGGLDYLTENPDLMPYIMHYLQYDEGEFGQSLRDVLKDKPEGSEWYDKNWGQPEHKLLHAVSEDPGDRTEIYIKEGLLGPETLARGFGSKEEREMYVKMMEEANKKLAKQKKKKKKK